MREILDKFRQPDVGRRILNKLIPKLERLNDRLGRKLNLMEVCGTHTVNISQTGIRELLLPYVNLKSGPGCPVCVTDYGEIDWMLALADIERVIITTFGDMMRVPGSGGSLMERRAAGADVRVVYSGLDAVKTALNNPQWEVVFLGVGFETTVPTVAASLQEAESMGIRNFSVFSAHKVVPPALRILLEDPEVNIDGLILPGHVSVIIGRRAWDFIAEEYGCPSAVVGFEAVDILLGINNLADQILDGKAEVANMYPRAVTEEGNKAAQELIKKYFNSADAQWRGIGIIPQSGLELADEFKKFDAKNKFQINPGKSREIRGCSCGDVLKGKIWPNQCPLFASVCTPMSPVGPCMVSSEGACAAYYRFHRNLKEGDLGG
ncbi:MAG TPA: hydrogenase formation protein HypD [Peptococcaceae bacterium]|nr:hydrogenase formation protein HypD [Peptococcaceae bacterium]